MADNIVQVLLKAFRFQGSRINSQPVAMPLECDENGALKVTFDPRQITVPTNLGGTGLTSYSEGDLIYGNSSGTLSKLSRPGSNTDKVLGEVSGLPAWVYSGGHVFEARLTLSTGVAVTVSDVANATTIYLTPHNGNRVRVYNGTRWVTYALTEKSLAIGTLASATIPNDIFLYDNAGTLTLEKLAWTNSTTRATGLTTQDGVVVKSGDTTRLYVGTFYPTSTTQVDDTAARRNLVNHYNKVEKKIYAHDSTDSWISSATAFEAWGTGGSGSTTPGVTRVQVLCPLGTELLKARFDADCVNATTSNGVGIGIGIDSTTVNSAGMLNIASVNSTGRHASAEYVDYPGIGAHYVQMLQRPNGGTSCTFYGDTGLTFQKSAMQGSVFC